MTSSEEVYTFGKLTVRFLKTDIQKTIEVLRTSECGSYEEMLEPSDPDFKEGFRLAHNTRLES